jgi:tRNA dimethylallyltransferase
MPEKKQKAPKRTHHFIIAEKECIIVVGPTAVGKTSEAIKIALALKTEIISADSRQCYKEMKIGVARPSDADLSSVRHHFIANHSIHENITAASFEKEALASLDIIFQTHDQAVVCGGTGLYIKALAEGLDDIPEVPIEVRNKAIAIHQDKGLEGLRDTLLSLDPGFAQIGDINNPNRMMRALEVILHTGLPIAHFQKGRAAKNIGEEQQYSTVGKRNFKIRYQFIQMPREELYTRINNRVEMMMTEGLEDEARSLFEFKHLPALQTVGYKELFDFFDGKCSREVAVEKIKQHTRNYAKRQITWFSRLRIDSI